MAKLILPADGAAHHHGSATANKFQWSNVYPTVSNGTHWRLKIGSAPFGYNYYFGNPVPFAQLYDATNKPKLMTLSNRLCYAVVEWSMDNGRTWNSGGRYTPFTCKP